MKNYLPVGFRSEKRLQIKPLAKYRLPLISVFQRGRIGISAHMYRHFSVAGSTQKACAARRHACLGRLTSISVFQRG
ncbi:hypothetical protein [Burkholderia gladioli]|uniref:hypothetical protein n=1 Tax=Burkholderia gladioli TaxID=28095 RepID=UPI0011B26155|nr:hypothetical protein [Burkholderia gladioli]